VTLEESAVDLTSTDSGTSSSPDSTTSLPPSTLDGGETLNPAWVSALDGVPEMFQKKITPHLREWDQNYSKTQAELKTLREQYEPYKPYVGTDPEVLRSAMGVLDAINTNPKDVYDRLTEYLQEQGLLEAPKVQKQEDEPRDLNEIEPWRRELEQKAARLEERQRAQDAYFEQQAYNQQVSDFQSEIDSQVQAVIGKYGEAVDIEDLLQRMKLQVDADEPFDAEKAFEQQKATFQRLYTAQSRQRPAPQIIPTTGTPAPSGDKKPEDMNEVERKAYFKHLLDIANSGG